ncbi:MAG TPA: hypothetical protein H9891_04345 [Candidatus Salinicoccus stercoripullorum]|uniref:Uncharacterized protein n=1 Tax=Candidatus Salinicoccus stercoripullorum TaxID=2838756 RepID=A0A9D1QFH9_9STAP|nr:hypothetical protein [Candidatus Salinicoccus stercoripullorum]
MPQKKAPSNQKAAGKMDFTECYVQQRSSAEPEFKKLQGDPSAVRKQELRAQPMS